MNSLELEVLSSDPTGSVPSGNVWIYSKLVSGVPKLYAKDTNGTIYALTVINAEADTLDPEEEASAVLNNNGTLVLGIPHGQQGIQGETGAAGVCTCTSDVPDPDPAPTDQELRCNIAAGVSDWVSNLIDDMIAKSTASATASAALLEVIGDLPGIDELGYDSLFTAITGIYASNIAALDAAFDTTYREQVIFCGLYESLGEDGVIWPLDNNGQPTTTSSVISAWKSKVSAHGGILESHVTRIIDSIRPVTWRRRAFIYSQEEGNCAACNEETTVNLSYYYGSGPASITLIQGQEQIIEFNGTLESGSASNYGVGFYCDHALDISFDSATNFAVICGGCIYELTWNEVHNTFLYSLNSSTSTNPASMPSHQVAYGYQLGTGEGGTAFTVKLKLKLP